MRTIIIFIAVFILCSSLKPVKYGPEKLTFSISVKQKKKKELIVNLRLTNNSADTVHYMSMSCSWWEFYTIDSKDFMPDSRMLNCDKNMPILASIPPYQDSNQEMILIGNPSLTGELKIGFYCTLQLSLNATIWPDTRFQKNIIWSNSLTVE